MPRFEHLFLARCPQCSQRIDDEAFTCINCGKGQIWATFPQMDGGTFLFGCHRCGDMYSSVGLFCPRCGTRIPIDYVRRRQATRSFLRALGAGGLAIVVIIAAMFLILWWLGYR
jgi:hypothetical protein